MNKIINWFQSEKRSFPWRGEFRDPYAVWVSEVMLQQTRAQVVIPYFIKWMSRFPTIQDLANASLSEALKLWEGLGYYSRARNLHAGANLIVEQFDGKMPDSEENLKKIKGLGPYTIGAILLFGFKKKALAIDGNVIRVITRYFLIQKDVLKTDTLKEIRRHVEDLLPNKDPHVFSEALIELGAIVCTPKPKCSLCPIKSNCQAKREGLIHSIPSKSRKEKITPLYRGVAVISSGGFYLVKKEREGVMKDLFEFPYLNIEPFESNEVSENIKKFFEEKFQMELIVEGILNPVQHPFTRFKAFLTPFLFKVKNMTLVKSYNWFSLEELYQLPFSSGHLKILRQL